MSNLKQAIAVGQYPAPCFDDPSEPKEKQHRRFLRRLVQQGMIRMVDAAGNALDVSAVFKGEVHYNAWHVDDQDAQVILEQIETETAKRKEERRQAAETAQKEAEEQEAERKRQAEERKARRDLLEVANQCHTRFTRR